MRFVTICEETYSMRVVLVIGGSDVGENLLLDEVAFIAS
jgi:hypothetical protein